VTLPDEVPPASESLEEAALRVVRWWETQLAPRLAAGDNLLVCARTASLRGLARIIPNLDD
jgi:2,3-bisphosphoglycerate-dependent phosphoglycerate mutase